MAKLDVYLRSIERFGAAGAVLASGQAVTLRFPAGDRQATQMTPHDALVALVREIAPPAVLAAIDTGRPARFDYEAYAIAVAPRPNAWQVTIEPLSGAAPAPSPPPPAGGVVELAAIERGQYDSGPVRAVAAPSSGSPLLDQLTSTARGLRATDIYISADAPPMLRIGGEVRVAPDRGPLDAETVSRELGQIAPPIARAAWSELGLATFTYGDATGRVRATLVRDHRGPGAALRLLVGDPPALDRIGAPRELAGWLDRRGLVLLAGLPGSGKTTTLASLVHALAERPRRVVAIEDPIEILHASPWVSQRAVGEHVPTVAAGVISAMREGADAIVVGAALAADSAAAVIEAVVAGHLVIAIMASATAATAASQLAELVGAHRKGAIDRNLLGAVGVVPTASGRTFEIATNPI